MPCGYRSVQKRTVICRSGQQSVHNRTRGSCYFHASKPLQGFVDGRTFGW
jgi:hypothetical protein